MTERLTEEKKPRGLERIRNTALVIGGLGLLAFGEFHGHIFAEVAQVGLAVGALTLVASEATRPNMKKT